MKYSYINFKTNEIKFFDKLIIECNTSDHIQLLTVMAVVHDRKNLREVVEHLLMNRSLGEINFDLKDQMLLVIEPESCANRSTAYKNSSG